LFELDILDSTFTEIDVIFAFVSFFPPIPTPAHLPAVPAV
jgi:hypothetical protein